MEERQNFNIRTNNQTHLNDTTKRNYTNINEINYLLDVKLPQKLYELEEILQQKKIDMKSAFEFFPGNYNVLETLSKNEHFTKEILNKLKHINELNQINIKLKTKIILQYQNQKYH